MTYSIIFENNLCAFSKLPNWNLCTQIKIALLTQTKQFRLRNKFPSRTFPQDIHPSTEVFEDDCRGNYRFCKSSKYSKFVYSFMRACYNILKIDWCIYRVHFAQLWPRGCFYIYIGYVKPWFSYSSINKKSRRYNNRFRNKWYCDFR